MTLDDELTQAEYLEQLARAVKTMDSRIGVFERERLEALLGEPGGVRVGSPGIPGMSLGASDLNRTLGNVAPFYGQTNLLTDPSFEQMDDISDVLTTENTFGLWRAKYVLNSGTAPSNKTIGRNLNRGSDYNPFNSTIVQLFLASFASSSTTWYLYPTTGFIDDADVATLPFLVASCRIADVGNSLNIVTNITSITVTLQIIDGSDAVVAASPALDFKALVARRPEIQQLVAAFQPGNATYRWRLKVDVVASGAGGTIRLKVGEPMLHYAYSPDPSPFAPQLGRWDPRLIVNANVNSNSPGNIVAATLNGQDADLFSISGLGEMEWANGTGGAADAFLKRSASGGLQVGDDVSGGIIDRYNGADVFNTYTPTVGGGGSVTWTTRTGWWQRIGKMVFVNIDLVVNAAGSGASTVTITLPSTPVTTAQALNGHRGTAAPFGPISCAVNASGIAQVRQSDGAVITGADLGAGVSLAIQGWYRAA